MTVGYQLRISFYLSDGFSGVQFQTNFIKSNNRICYNCHIIFIINILIVMKLFLLLLLSLLLLLLLIQKSNSQARRIAISYNTIPNSLSCDETSLPQTSMITRLCITICCPCDKDEKRKVNKARTIFLTQTW